MPRSEHFFDLLIRLLMFATVGFLIVCVGFLVYRWTNPPAMPSHDVTLIEVPLKTSDSLQQAAIPLPEPAQVLLAPGRVFKCIQRGHVTFSDQACASAAFASETR